MFLNAKASGTDAFNSYIELVNQAASTADGKLPGQGPSRGTGVTNGNAIINPDIFYTKQLLDTIRVEANEYVYYRYAETQPMGDKANKLTLRRWSPLQAHTIPLVEGIPPITDKGTVEAYEIDTAQYGRYMEFSDKVDFKVVDPIIAHYAAEYSTVAIETLDMLAREALFAVADKHYAGMYANEADLIAAINEDKTGLVGRPSMADLRKIVLSLKKKLVKPRSNGRYHVIAGPEFYFDMIDDPIVENYMKINNTTKTMYEDSMLVPMFNMEFYETLVAPNTNVGYEMVDGSLVEKHFVVNTSTGVISAATSSTGTSTNFGSINARGEITGRDSETGLPNGRYVYDGKYYEYNDEKATGSYIPYGTQFTPATGYSEFKFQHVLILGKDALIRTGISGQDSARMYTKPLGSSGVLDPIDQRQSIGFKINDVGFGSARTEAIVDYICVPSQLNI
jgi:hypothetical protein